MLGKGYMRGLIIGGILGTIMGLLFAVRTSPSGSLSERSNE